MTDESQIPCEELFSADTPEIFSEGPVLTPFGDQQLRIEALRAAAMVTKIKLEEISQGRKGYSCRPVLDVAEQFLAWLEGK